MIILVSACITRMLKMQFASCLVVNEVVKVIIVLFEKKVGKVSVKKPRNYAPEP
jgi:hypothetical protein